MERSIKRTLSKSIELGRTIGSRQAFNAQCSSDSPNCWLDEFTMFMWQVWYISKNMAKHKKSFRKKKLLGKKKKNNEWHAEELKREGWRHTHFCVVSSMGVFIIFGCDIFKNKRKFNQLQNSPLGHEWMGKWIM